MSKAWMPLYIADYRADTAHLTAAQHGAYLLLIMHYWSTGNLPDDDGALARIACMTPAEWRKNRPTIAAFFGDGWTHKRINNELAKSAEISSKRAASAKQRHSKSDANAEQMDTQSQSQSPKKQGSPDGASGRYAFESGVIKLNQRDYERWKASFSHINLDAELVAIAPWAEQQGKNWFHAVPNALRNKNQQAKERQDALAKQGGFKWNGEEGII